MSEKVNLKIMAEGKGVDSDFGFDVTVNYYNMGRSKLAELESQLVPVFGDLAKTQITPTDPRDARPTYRDLPER